MANRDIGRLANIGENKMVEEFDKNVLEATHYAGNHKKLDANIYIKRAEQVLGELERCGVDTARYQAKIKDTKRLYKLD